MTYNRVPEYKLADKLEKQFRGRGADLRGMRATPTSELMKRAEMGRDPRVNCAEQAFRENYLNHKNGNGKAAAQKSVNGYGMTQTANASFTTARKTQKSRAAYGNTVHANENHRTDRAESMPKTAKQTAEKRERVKVEAHTLTPSPELRAPRKPMNFSFLFCLLVGTMMIMFLVIGISDVYQSSVKLSDLEQQITAKREYAEQLELELEEKNDIRVIEAIASEQLGMVKEDSVQRKYISLSDGEHIELIENTDDEESVAAGGMMLSSIFSSLEQFFDRFE